MSVEEKTHYSVPVLDKGHVYLEQCVGDDLSIANAARVSFAKRSNDLSDADAGIIKFLCRNRHGTPFEHNSLTFVVKAPIMVFREWHRHRIASVNEMSARYTPMPAEWYVPAPEQIRIQKGKPGDYYFETLNNQKDAAIISDRINATQRAAYDTYRGMVEDGIAKEIARTVLPVGMYSEMWWTVNLRALMNFLSLRNHKHAMWEIQEYARAIEEIAIQKFPVAMTAFIDNDRIAP